METRTLQELIAMSTLAFDGPGPWILLVPLLWAAAVVTTVTALRRTAGRRRVPGTRASGPSRPTPIDILGRRFASGEIDDEEYRSRLSVLEERFGARRKDDMP